MKIKRIDTIKITQGVSPLIYLLKFSLENPGKSVHLEDIAIETKKLFPSFFGWSKYKDHIDLRQVMRSMDSLKRNGFVVGSNISNWALTRDGYEYAKKFDLTSDLFKSRRVGNDINEPEISRIKASKCYNKYLVSKNFENVLDNEIKYLQRINDYMNLERLEKIREKMRLASVGDNDLTNFLELLFDETRKRKII